MANQKTKADPTKTGTGKQRLGHLNIRQLYELLEKENKPKNKAKVRSRIRVMEGRGHRMPEPIAEPAAEVSE